MSTDLRDNAREAIAAYMHHELQDAGLKDNMIPFLKDSVEELLSGVDRAIGGTIAAGKELGIIA